ncbi:LamG-like jellyroll fold domain-containing protein [Streptomyces sp. NPDC006465]|uniref:LamG-like jellyroll fold domain-containing protein n=1 Tax=Streptomyces sp. NPDC006465 TaxID=3157174 RepID=UPI0033B9986F
MPWSGSFSTGFPSRQTLRHPHVLIGGGYASTGWDDQASGYRNFTGQIDEVAFYDKPLVSFTKSGSTWTYPWYLRLSGYTDTANRHIQARRALVSGTGDQYQGVVGADAPAAYWRIGEADTTDLHSEIGGPDLDATFHRDSGTLYQSTLDQTGVFGPGDDRAVHLGSGGHIQMPGSILAGATDLSAEMWFRTSTASAVLMSFQNAPIGQTPTSWRAALNIDGSGKLRGEFLLSGASGATPIVSTQTVTDNEWHHVALSGSGTTQTLYLDGVKVGSLAGTIGDQARPYAYIGGGYGSSGWMGLDSDTYYFKGDLDEVALYRSALTADQVSAHYRAQAEAADSGLTSTVTITDPKQKTSSTSYDALHGQRLVSHTDATGAVTGYAYDTGGNLHTVTDPNGHTTVTGHDARGNTVSNTTCRDADSCWTNFTSYYLNASDPLDPRNDKPLTHRDQRSADYKDGTYKTSYTYNTKGLPLSTVRADNSSASTTYTAGSESAVGGGTVPAGLVATQRTPGGATTLYHYYASGDLADVTSPSGLVTSYAYDGLGRKTSEKQVSDTFPAGVSTSYGYDTASHVVTETGAGVKNEVTDTTHTAMLSRAYDEDGNLLSESTKDTTGGDPERSITYHYNTRGLNDSVTDAEQKATLFEHDELGRVTGTTDAAGTHFIYTYTPRGQHASTVLNNWTGDPSGTTRDLTVVSNAYDPAGRLASTTDAMGATTAYTYFDDGLTATTTAKQVTQANGTKHDIVVESNTYDPAGQLTKQVTGGGTATQTFTVDALGRTKTSVLDPGGLNRTSTFTYDDDDRVKEQTQSITGTKKLTNTAEYDLTGNVTKQTITDGTSTHITTATYDDRSLPLTKVSPRGNAAGADPAAYTTTYRYDALGRPVQETEPSVQVEENGATPTTAKPTALTGYNTFGEATETKGPRGKTIRTETDRLGRPVAVTLPDYTPPGATTALTATVRTSYSPLGLPQTVTDPLGRITRYGYDQFGQQTSKTDPAADATTALLSDTDPDLIVGPLTSIDGGGVTSTTWTPTGRQLEVTDPTGARTEATYDELGRQLTTTTVERYPSLTNLTSRYTWDDANNQTASTTPGGITTTGTYNPAGEVNTLTTPAGTAKLGYDGLGRQVETTDATDRRIATAYDALGNVTATTDYGTGTTALRTAAAEFDTDGNRTAVISPQTNARTTFAYDALGRVTTQVEPVSGNESITTTFGYDAAGNRTRLTDGRGNKTVYTFNSWALPESTVEPSTTAHPAAADRTWTTLYDKAGQAVTELVPGGIKRDRTYDALGRLTHETGTGAETETTDRSLGYDLAGHLTSAGTTDGLTRNTYTYNDRGQLLTANGPGGASSYAYNVDGNMTMRQTTAGTTNYGYDSAGRIDWAWDSITNNDIWYDFDAAGRPTLEQYATTAATVTAKRTYAYDNLGRLKSDGITTPDGAATTASITYGYDLDDNLTSKKTTGTAGAGDNTYSYDDADRLKTWTKDGSTTSYEWDAAGNRTKAGSASATFDARNRQLTEGASQFTYSARGTLTSVDASSPRSTTFDAFDRKIRDGSTTYSYDSLDRIQQRNTTTFTYDGGSNNLANDGTTKYNRTPDGSLLALSTGTTKQWALTDQHTDLVAGLTTDATQVSGSTSYTPFGIETAVAGTTPALGYQSGWTDPTSGDVNMAARWYQPGTGSFTSRDSWQLDPIPSGEANRYNYIGSSPLRGTDPTGHTKAVDAMGGLGWGAGAGGLSGGGKALGTGLGITTALGGLLHIFDQATRSTGGTTTGSYGGSYSFSNPFASSASGLYSQADNFGWQGDSALVSTGPGVYTCMHACNSAGTVPRVLVPPRPPIDQNPNNGKNPQPAPTRPAPKVDWDPKNGGFKPGDGWQLIFGALRMLDLGDDDEYRPSDSLETLPVPTNNPGGKNDGRTRDDNRCDVGPGVSPTGHAVYLPRERYYDTFEQSYQCRATGVYGLLDYSDYNKGRKRAGTNTNDSTQPPGMREIRAQGHIAANGHLIPAAASGSGIDLRNLVAEYQKANTPYIANTVETDIRNSVKSGKTLAISITPHYGNDGSGIPTEIEYNYGTVEDGNVKHCVITQLPTGGTTRGSADCRRR